MDKIVKRDGAIVPFDSEKIEKAILKAAKVTKEFGEEEAKKVTQGTQARRRRLWIAVQT